VTNRSRTQLRVESLEARRTPATLINPKTVTFQDADGDTVKVAFSKPVLTAANKDAVFHFNTGTVDGSTSAQQLETLDLTGLPAGLSVSVSAVQAGAGNGTVDVGWIKADTLDEGAVSVSGDLGRLTAGDATTKTPGVKSLTVGSLGARGLVTQGGAGTLATVVAGALSKLTVTGDVTGSSVSATGAADGKIGAVKIGGSLRADAALADTGLIKATGAITSLTVSGEIVGGAGANSGVHSGGLLGAVTVGGSVTGGAGDRSAAILGDAGIKSVTIGGSVSGIGNQSGSIIAGIEELAGGTPTAGGNLGAVTIGGDLRGGNGAYSAAIMALETNVGTPNTPQFVGGKLTSVTVAGDLVGGGGRYSAGVYAGESIGAVNVQSLTGGGGYASAGVITALGSIKSVTVTGAVTGGGGDFSGAVFAANVLGAVKVGGDVTGAAGYRSGSFSGYDLTGVTIGGKVTGGAGGGSGGIKANHNLGLVKVAGDWTAASIAAGVNPQNDGFFDTADDTRTAGTIAGITIGGKVNGTAAAGDHFAFIATQIKALSIAGKKITLQAGPTNDDLVPSTVTTGDFRVVELGPTPS
jgi:hypothetical protein